MSYTRFCRMVEKDYKGDTDALDREKITKKLKIGELQFAAFKSRMIAEREAKKRADKLNRAPSPQFARDSKGRPATKRAPAKSPRKKSGAR